MIKKSIEIYVPLMETEFDNYFQKFEIVLNELCSLSETLYVHFYDDVKTPLKIERPSKTEIQKNFSRKTERKTAKYFLKFSTEYLFNSEHEIDNLLFLITTTTEKYVTHLLIYLNIAKPGAFDSRDGVIIETLVYGDKTKYEKKKFDALINGIHLSLELVLKYKWPPIQELKIKDVLEWLKEHWEAFNCMPTNRIERALNAFSYLFHNTLADSSASDLFFSLVGIEALFVDGNESVQKQVDIKSQLLLGNRTEFKKKFNELYEFRSRYIHGQLNFVNKYYLRNADTDLEEHVFKTYDNADLAMLILITSIQKHLLLNKNELVFDLVLKE